MVTETDVSIGLNETSKVQRFWEQPKQFLIKSTVDTSKSLSQNGVYTCLGIV